MYRLIRDPSFARCRLCIVARVRPPPSQAEEGGVVEGIAETGRILPSPLYKCQKESKTGRVLPPLLRGWMFGCFVNRENFFIVHFFRRARVCLPLLSLCRPICTVFLNPESCLRKQVHYELSHPSP
jgi:hypothetical protein